MMTTSKESVAGVKPSPLPKETDSSIGAPSWCDIWQVRMNLSWFEKLTADGVDAVYYTAPAEG